MVVTARGLLRIPPALRTHDLRQLGFHQLRTTRSPTPTLNAKSPS
jgi:hypothetical protein